MFAVLPWIKSFVVIAFIALAASSTTLWYRLDAEQIANKNLTQKLKNAADANNANQLKIEALTADKAKDHKLMVNRQLDLIKQKEKLNADIKALQSELKAIDCYHQPWPDRVLKRLRESY